MKNLLSTVALVVVLTVFYGLVVFVAVEEFSNLDPILRAGTLGK